MSSALGDAELARIREHKRLHPMTLALLRTEHAPGELAPILEDAGRRLGVELKRVYSSPTSEFCMAEFASGGSELVMLFLHGRSTELLSVSEIDEVAVKDLEDSIHYSNFHSEIMRHGL